MDWWFKDKMLIKADMARKGMVVAAFTVALVLALPSRIKADSLSRAEDLYQHTDYKGSLALLDKNTQDARTNFLIGRNYFMEGELKRATTYLEKSSQQDPVNSEYMDWLGRIYGKRAETSSMITAPGFANKARQAFERAVELDSTNKDALSDLFDYYLDAPGFMGGGYDKAAAIAEKTTRIDPPEAYFERAKLAQKRKEYTAAENHLRKAAALAPEGVGYLVNLAKLLAKEGRTQESDEVFRQAESIKPNTPAIWYAHADALINQQRELDEARTLLEKYMHASITPDDPPKQEAMRLLRQIGKA
jgi:tetratricopeptide (TPR) repeat protein